MRTYSRPSSPFGQYGGLWCPPSFVQQFSVRVTCRDSSALSWSNDELLDLSDGSFKRLKPSTDHRNTLSWVACAQHPLETPIQLPLAQLPGCRMASPTVRVLHSASTFTGTVKQIPHNRAGYPALLLHGRPEPDGGGL